MKIRIHTVHGFLFALCLSAVVVVSFSACSSKSDPLPKTGNERNYYLQNCATCHGSDGGGTVRGVQLKGRKLDQELIKKKILYGDGMMPRFNLSEPMLTDLSQWISELK